MVLRDYRQGDHSVGYPMVLTKPIPLWVQWQPSGVDQQHSIGDLYYGLLIYVIVYGTNIISAGTNLAFWPYQTLWSHITTLRARQTVRSASFAWLAYLTLSALFTRLVKAKLCGFQTRSLSRVLPITPPSDLVSKHYSLIVSALLLYYLLDTDTNITDTDIATDI